MDVNEPTVHLTADELSDRSNSSNSESQLHAFQEYGKVKELNLSMNKTKQSMICKAKDFSIVSENNRFENLPSDASTTDRIAKDPPLSLERSRNFGYSDEKSKSASSFSIDNLEDTDTSVDATKDYTVGINRSIKDTKDIIFGYDQFGKDNSYSRDQRAKNIQFAIDISKESAKAFNYSLDRKDFSFALDPRRDILLGANAPDHFRSGNFRDVIEHRTAQIQHRHLGFGTLGERIRRPHILAPDLQAHLTHSHSLTQMQNSPQQQQQQCKSFTIDAILGLGNNPRDKQQRGRYNAYRKHQGQEGSTKNNSSGSSSGGSGKLKRVRTIFTAEQLERLEGEFARQQYMVGPERLYLAHALRLSEAQVKVWFQNRRIKWRKLSREQQTQHRHTSLEQEVEDSNGNTDWSDTPCPKSTNLLEVRTGNHDSSKILETISEHTEPSPTASATMDQPELETQTQTRKTRTGRQVTSRSPATWSSRLPAQGSNSADTYWKSRQTQSNSHSHSRRKPDYDATEPVTSYSASNTYRTKQRALSSSGFPKLPQTASSDQTYRMPRQTLQSTRNKLLTGTNYAVVRKSCYKPDLEDEDETKYEDEEVAYTEDNAEDDVADEADEDQDDNDQYNDKEYEEQEADDEIDDESDAFQSQLQRTQHIASKDLNLKTQHLRHPDPQLDLRKLRRQQYAHKLYQEQKCPRYCSPSYEAEHVTGQDTSYGDVADLMTDEERTPPPSPSRRSTMRTSDIRSVMPHWQHPRKSLERHRTRTMPASTQQRQSQPQSSQQHRPQYQPSSRLGTLKPELESLMMPQATNTVVKKCYICKDSTNPILNKIGSAMRGHYRLQEYRGFTVKGPPGEDGEAVERSICARCARQLNMGDFRTNCEAISNPESHFDNKLHRLRTYRPKNYEAAEDQTVDEMSSMFGSAPSRTVDYAVPRDGTRHSIQSTRSPLRRTSCYER